MADISYTLSMMTPCKDLFYDIFIPKGLNKCWTKSCEGEPLAVAICRLDYGESYLWEAIVSKYKQDKLFELTMTKANKEWANTKMGFSLTERWLNCRALTRYVSLDEKNGQ